MTTPHWYVVRTKPRTESLAAQELNQLDIDVFSPLIPRNPIDKGQPPVPLFPGYVFIRSEGEEQVWPLLRRCQHVLGLLTFDGDAPWLTDQVIDELKVRCQSLNDAGGIWSTYQPGDWVQVVNSTLEGIGQVVEDGKSLHSPVRILLHIFERLVPVQVSRHNLESLENAPNEHFAPRRTRGKGRWIRGFGTRVNTAA